MKDGKQKRRVLWVVMLIIFSVIFFAVLELGKHTVFGWILTAVLIALFVLIRKRFLNKTGKLPRFLINVVFAALFTAGAAFSTTFSAAFSAAAAFSTVFLATVLTALSFFMMVLLLLHI